MIAKKNERYFLTCDNCGTEIKDFKDKKEYLTFLFGDENEHFGGVFLLPDANAEVCFDCFIEEANFHTSRRGA